MANRMETPIIEAQNVLLERDVLTYFNEKIDIRKYAVVSGLNVTNIALNNEGFLFVSGKDNSLNYRQQMRELRDTYASMGRDIKMEFCDYQVKLSGFSWKKDDAEVRTW